MQEPHDENDQQTNNKGTDQRPEVENQSPDSLIFKVGSIQAHITWRLLLAAFCLPRPAFCFIANHCHHPVKHLGY